MLEEARSQNIEPLMTRIDRHTGAVIDTSPEPVSTLSDRKPTCPPMYLLKFTVP